MPSVTEKPMGTLFAKLARIQAAVGRVAKTGYNSFHGYKYVTEADLIEEVKAQLVKENVAYFFSVEDVIVKEWPASGTDKYNGPVVFVQGSATFADGESGQTFAVKGAGAGQDKGDKGIYKAITGMQKYVLMKTFLVPTGDDPESETGVAPQRGAEKAAVAATVPTEKPAKKSPAPAAAPALTLSKADDMAAITAGPMKGRATNSLSIEEAESHLGWLEEKNFGKSKWADMARNRISTLTKLATAPAGIQAVAGELELTSEPIGVK